MLERSLRLALRNYVTLFLFAAAATVTIHLVYLFLFRDVAGVTELHDAIEAFPPRRQVRGVGRSDLTAWRVGAVVVLALEIALVPLLAKGASRVLEQDEGGEMPTVMDALRATWRGGYPWFPSLRNAGPLFVTACLAIVIWFLVRTTGGLFVEPLGADVTWAALAVVEGAARAAGAPFVLVSVVLRKSRPKGPEGLTPTSY